MNNARCLKVYLTRVKDHDAHHHSRLPFKSSFTLHSPGSFSPHTITRHISCFYCGPRGASFAPSMRGKKEDGILSCSSASIDRRETTSKLKRLEIETSTRFERWRDLTFDERRIFWTVNEKCSWALEWNRRAWLKVIFCCVFRSIMKHIYRERDIYIYICLSNV